MSSWWENGALKVTLLSTCLKKPGNFPRRPFFLKRKEETTEPLATRNHSFTLSPLPISFPAPERWAAVLSSLPCVCSIIWSKCLGSEPGRRCLFPALGVWNTINDVGSWEVYSSSQEWERALKQGTAGEDLSLGTGWVFKMLCSLEAAPMHDTANSLSSFSVEGSKRLWNTDPLTGILYQINSKSALTWHQARASCKQQNAELLSVTEIHEQMYLTGNDRQSLPS